MVYSGVSPLSFVRLTSAPDPTSSRTMSSCPALTDGGIQYHLTSIFGDARRVTSYVKWCPAATVGLVHFRSVIKEISRDVEGANCRGPV
jgi:hypothetical protein